MRTTLLIVYILVVVIIILKTLGIILILKGFINKIQKQWVNGFVLLAIAFIMFALVAVMGINTCLNYSKQQHDFRKEECRRHFKCMRGPAMMNCPKMMQGMGEFNCCMHNMKDSTMCKNKMEMHQKHMMTKDKN